MSIYRNIGLSVLSLLLAGCAPRVATSFWRIGTSADSTREGYAVLYEGKKMRHCYPITEWHDTLPSLQGGVGGRLDTYHSLHHHGIAVESELMAYRIYFDKKQTIDPYCKRKPQLELAQSHWYPNDSLLAEGYGDDILRVSGTVGVGSVKYWLSPLHGAGEELRSIGLPVAVRRTNKGGLVHFENVSERSERIVSQSRNSATIEVAVKGWQVPLNNSQLDDFSQLSTLNSQLVNLSVQYTMRAGHRDMRCDVYCSSPLHGGIEGGLCTGVQTIPAKGGWPTDTIVLPDGTIGLGNNSQLSIINCKLENGVLLASWGTDWPVNDSAKYAKETVGLGVFIPYPYAGTPVHDKQNNLCLLNLTGKAGLTAKRSYSGSGLTAQRSEMATAHFYLTVVGATKENHPVATTAEEWYAYLKNWVKRLK